VDEDEDGMLEGMEKEGGRGGGRKRERWEMGWYGIEMVEMEGSER
jgi:hypothetical protein